MRAPSPLHTQEQAVNQATAAQWKKRKEGQRRRRTTH